MIRRATDYLEISAQRFPEKVAFTDPAGELTFSGLRDEAQRIAMPMIKAGIRNSAVAVYLDKSVECIAAFLGATYSGNFYCPIDTRMPAERINKVFSKLQPAVVITDRTHYEAISAITIDSVILVYEDQAQNAIDSDLISEVVSATIDTDPLYILFTSGSTGMPKGAIVSHRALIDFIEWGSDTFGYDEYTIFGNQTPLYFSMSVLDIYQTLRNGAAMHIIPRELFSFPVKLMEYMHDRKVNTLNWVPSAMTFISAIGALNEPHLDDLKVVTFGGEVMPVKHLNLWMEAYPGVRFINIYGSTEDTDTCTYYEVNRRFADTDRLPIGKGCDNKGIILLNDADELIPVTDTTSVGELCVRGTGLSNGYYNDPEKTKECFVQNPLITAYPDLIYRTGDLAKYNEYGELEYISRKDFQIKHKGHRIELSEIEVAASSIDGVTLCGCIYDDVRSRILLFYTGSIEPVTLMNSLKELIPDYMIPRKCTPIDEMPLNTSGKIDRPALKTKYL